MECHLTGNLLIYIRKRFLTSLSGSKEKFSKNYSRPSMDAVDYAIVIAQSDDVELTALYVASSPTRNDYTSDTPETVKDIVYY